MNILPWNTCTRCASIPEIVSVDFLDKESEGIPKPVKMLPGMEDYDLASGYQSWEMTCNLCGTRYRAEVDVEPMVWDFTLTRLKEGAE